MLRALGFTASLTLTLTLLAAAGCGTTGGQCNPPCTSGCCLPSGLCGSCGSGGGSGGSGGSGGTGGGTNAGCNASNCAGCCLNEVCQPGSTAAACGKNAAACVACGSGQICKVDQTCGVDPNSMWKVQPASATVRSTDSGGVAWDALGGAPDPYCDLYCPASAATITATTSAPADVFTPTWTTGSCVMKASDLMATGFKIGVYDEDVSDDDVISAAGTITVTQADLLAGFKDLTNNTTLVTLRVLLQRQ